MKILIVHTYYKLHGGEDAVVQNEMELLRSDGHDVALLDFHNASATLLKVLLMPFNPFTYNQVTKKVKSFKPDLIHIHNLHFAGTASVLYAAKKMQVPIVMTIHNYRMLCPSGSLFFDNKLFLESLNTSFPWSAVQKGVYQQSKLITLWLALSNHLHCKLGTWKLINSMIFLGAHSETIFKERGILNAQTKTFLKPNFTTQKKSDSGKESGNYYLFVGRLSEEKGLKTLLGAFENYPAHLRIAGTGPLKDLVTEAAGRCNNIDYVGHLSKSQIEKMIAGAKALIFPSEWYETFGMVMIEAFALGIPVIASNLGNIPSIVKDQVNGITFSTGNIQNLREKLTFFENMNDHSKQKLAEGATSSYHEHYTPEINLKQLTDIYSNTLSRKSHS